jgi:hypothetical protein
MACTAKFSAGSTSSDEYFLVRLRSQGQTITNPSYPVVCAGRLPREPVRRSCDASPACPVASLDRRVRTVRPHHGNGRAPPEPCDPTACTQPRDTKALRSSRPRRAHVSRIGSQAAGHNVALGYPSKARQRSVPALGNSRPAYNHRLLTLLGLVSSAASEHRPRSFPQDLQVEG